MASKDKSPEDVFDRLYRDIDMVLSHYRQEYDTSIAVVASVLRRMEHELQEEWDLLLIEDDLKDDDEQVE